MAEAGKVWVPVLPSMRGFVNEVKATTKRIGDVGVKIAPIVNGRELKTKVESAAKAANTKVVAQLELDIKAAQARRAIIDRELAELGRKEVSPEVTLKTAKLNAEMGRLDAKIEQMSAKRVDIQGQIDVDTAAANTKVSVWRQLVSRQSATVKLDVDTGPAIIRVAALARALGTIALPAAAVAIVPYALSLGSALMQATGAAALLPAAIGAGAVAVGVFKVGLSGMGDALKYAFDPKKTKEFQEALGKLAPSAQQSVLAIKGLGPAFTEMKLDVQGRLFDGLNTKITQTGQTYLPILRGTLGGLASDLNGYVKDAFDEVFLAQDNITGTATAMGFVRTGVSGIFSAIAPLSQAFVTLFIHGAPYIARFGAFVGEAAGAFSLFIANASRAGLIEVWINNALLVLGQLWQVAVNVGSILGSLFDAGARSGESFLGVLVRITGGMAAALRSPEGAGQLQSVITGIRDVVGTLWDKIVVLWPGISSLAGAFFSLMGAAAPITLLLANVLAPVLTVVGNVLSWMAPVLGPLIGLWLAWQGVLAVSAGAMLLVNGAVALFSFTMGIVRGVIMAVQVAQWLWNAALSANPIGLVIIAIAALVAGVIYAWNNFAWFRDVVMTVWGALQTAFTAIGTAAVWLWQTIFVPAWQAISTAISTAWTAVIWPVLSAIGTALSYLGLAITVLLVTPFYLAWQAIAAVATWAWTTILQPTWQAIQLGLQLLGAVFSWLWMAVIVPVWNGITAAIGAAWAFVRDSIFVPIMNFIRGQLAAAWNFYWNGVIVPVWNGIMNVISTAWNFIRDNIFNPIMNFIRGPVASTWNFLWQNVIVPVWEGIKSAISGAWQFIQGVFDVGKRAVDAVGQAFQFVADWIGRAWATIREAARGPVQFVVDVVYNNGIRPVWNGIAGLFGMAQLGPVTFARGGVLPGYAPGRDTVPALLSRGEGVLVPEAVRGLGPAFVGWANRHFSGGRSDGGPGTGFAKGGVAGASSSIPRFAEGGIVDWVTDMGSDMIGFLTDVFSDAAGAVKRLFASVIDSGNNTPGQGGWTDALKAVPGKAVEGVIKKVKEWVESIGAMGMGGGNWAPVALQALAMAGQSARWLPNTLAQIQIESGGNPRAINNWDINAKRGTPSMGLLQTILPTFNAYAGPLRGLGPYHPLANIYAAIRYTVARYGSLAKWPTRGGYDSGGVLPPGASFAVNNTGGNEHLAVFTKGQWGILRVLITRLADLPGALQKLVTGLRDALKPKTPTATPAALMMPGGVAMAPTSGYVADRFAGGTGVGAGGTTPVSVAPPVAPVKVTPPPARPGLSPQVRSAAQELLRHMESGGRYFEDFSFKGYSANLRANNDVLADAYYGQGGKFAHEQIKAWLRRILAQGHFDSGGLARGLGVMAKQVISPERVLSPRQTAAFERIVPVLNRMGSRGLTGMDFSPPGGRGEGGVNVHVHPSARMDESDLADAAVHRLNWEMGLIS